MTELELAGLEICLPRKANKLQTGAGVDDILFVTITLPLLNVSHEGDLK